MPDYIDHNHYTLRVRAHEWAHRQTVSLLELGGLGRGSRRKRQPGPRLIALWKCGVTTASQLRTSDPQALADKLQAHVPPSNSGSECLSWVHQWQEEILLLWSIRGERRSSYHALT